MKVFNLSLAALLMLFLITAFSASIPMSSDVLVLKKISIDDVDFHLKQDDNGNQGVYCEVSGQISGLQGRKINIFYTPKLPDGTNITASAQARKEHIQKDHQLQWRKSLSVHEDPQVFRSKDFIPFNAMRLPPGTETIIIRGHVFSDNIASYTDASIHVKPSNIQLRGGLLVKSVRIGRKEQSYNMPNPSGRETAEPNILMKKVFLTFVSSNIATRLKGKSLYSGVFFKHPGGDYVKPSQKCPKGNVGSKGQAQFQQIETITSSDMKQWGKELKVPLDALALDSSQSHHIIAVYYVSSNGLWNVRKFEIYIPAVETNFALRLFR